MNNQEILTLVIIIVIVVLLLLISGGVFSYFYTNKIAKRLYKNQWTRNGDYSFERGCSDASVDYHLDMFNKGMEYREKNKKYIKEVDIISEGLHLYGEYYDFGFDKATIVMPGRMETAYYGAFYVDAFKKAGFNVLCTDPRAHGLSEGEFITLGKHESLDNIAWAKLLHDKFGVKHINLFGICGGATCACYILTNKDCPSYIDSFISDGMFYSFYVMYKGHIKDEKKPVFPVLQEVFHYIKKYNDVNPYKASPKDMLKKIKTPLLMISGEKDKFALPKYAQKLFDLSTSDPKKIEYIPNARHSHVRYDNQEAYDKAIYEFLTKIY